MDETTWHSLRKMGIGASDVSAILGHSRFKSKSDVYASKVLESGDSSSGLQLKLGKMLEPIVIRLYEEETGEEVKHNHENRLSYSKEMPWALCTVDGVVGSQRKSKDGFELSIGKDSKIVEVKTTGSYSLFSDGIPLEYQCQGIWQMYCTGVRKLDFAVLISNSKFQIHTLEWDEEVAEAVVSEVEKFWDEHIVPKVPPAPDGSDGAKSLLEQKYNEHNGEYVDGSDIKDKISKLKEIDALLKNGTEMKAKITQEICDFIGENKGVTVDNLCKITWSQTKSSESIDWKTYVKDNVEVDETKLDKYKKVRKGYRRFNTKWIEE